MATVQAPSILERWARAPFYFNSATQLGRNGREHAKEDFLMTSNVKRYLLLCLIMLGMARPEKEPIAK